MVAKGERNSRSLQGPLHTPNHGITPNDNNHPAPKKVSTNLLTFSEREVMNL